MASEAAQRQEALLRQKRAYWDRLNGYEFEMATAEVLKLHRFNSKAFVDLESRRTDRAPVKMRCNENYPHCQKPNEASVDRPKNRTTVNERRVP